MYSYKKGTSVLCDIPYYELRRVLKLIDEKNNENLDGLGWEMKLILEESDCLELFTFSSDRGTGMLRVLCGNRVSQMTRTYHDIEAVTRLLQEKERDLELAARIGQQLLARNKCLEEKNTNLEAELASSAEKITQLRHDLLMKTDLLQIYTNDVDESSVESTPTGFRHINIDLLQRRVKNLENENVTLREEASQLACDTQYCEEKEKELVNDVIKQLNDANLQVAQMSEELSKKIEDNLRLQEETTQLLAQVVELQNTAKRLTRENEELGSLVGVARECQEELTTELAELKEKYAEVLDLLHDTQEQLRRAQKKNYPGSRGSHLGGSMFSSFHSAGSDSIASELHSLSSGEEMAEKADGVKSLNRVFDTVRLSSKLSGSLPSGGSVYSTPTRQASQLHSHLGTPLHTAGRYSPFFGSCGTSLGYSSGLPSLDSGAESDGSFPTDSEDNYPASRPGVPGWPGTPDLDSCLRRLGPHERSHLYLPYGCRTPDSIMSTGSAKSGVSGYASQQDWKLPQKLQIVKPIEGSLTLHQWSRLATPHLGGLLEEKEGIAMKVKGITNTDLNLEVYSMSDLEEDEETELEEGKDDEELEAKGYPGKQFMATSGVFTYTNSTVLHPDDLTNLTSSLKSAQMSALPTGSIAPSLPPTPSHTASVPPSRRGSTATFSTNFAIAKHLNERVFADSHSGSGITATATPANSPEGSRKGSPEPQTYKLPGIEDLTRHIHAGASFLRRTFYGKDYSNPPSPPGCPEFNIVERVQELGVQKLVGTSRYSQSVGGVVTLRSHCTPPLLHLSNLIRSGSKTISGNAHTVTISSSYSNSPQPTTIVSSDERKPELPQGTVIGIPGHPGAGHLDSRLTQLKPGQRRDLGTVGSVGNRPRPSTLGTIPPGKRDEKMGTVGWTSLGRKGGLL
ncbi:Trafficking kinesin-binding protein 1 [Armadillidium nasatum]|uniref:Trafficking kinesin-binding protein 1 n=1 Tax=Armadillidium nasatum TaxID=96803 RepID=A0A5N5STI0_9CRUS|nr:Trafficking kinesin-binding protein 1 [Armadillidium nasatum]